MITGASGFLGQHLTRRLLSEGWSVRGLSRSPRPDHLSRAEWMSGDVEREGVVDDAIVDCSAVIHLACFPLQASAADPFEAQRVNVGGTLRVLEAARRARIGRVVYASTGQVYGGAACLPNVETQSCRPASVYAATKYCGEVWCQAYSQRHGVTVPILRLFNVYGNSADGQPRSTIESVFVRRLKAGQRPEVRGHPASGRDFVHVDDVIQAFILALVRTIDRVPVNVGTGVVTTFVDLARLLVQLFDAHIEPDVVETDERAERFQADTARARQVLGLEATIPLRHGLQRLVGET